MPSFVNLPVHSKTKERVDSVSRCKESYDQTINRLIDESLQLQKLRPKQPKQEVVRVHR
jgi:hypothetical protein